MKTLSRTSLLVLLLLVLPLTGMSQSVVITTYAGPPLPADGTVATTQALDAPSSIHADGLGGFYVCSSGANGKGFNRIYHVNASGTLTLFAGNGTFGFGGDGGPATSAPLGNPLGISLDAAGNLFIADTGNSRIRKVSPAGVITTVAGNGTAGFSGDGGPATSASLNAPSSVVADSSGNLYIADAANFRIRKVTPSGTISTVVGTGSSGFSDGAFATTSQISNVTSVTVDSAGNLYFADAGNARIRKVNTIGGISTYIGSGTIGFAGDGGVGIAAFINNPTSLSFDGAGNLYFTDTGNFRVRKATTSTNLTTVIGNGTNSFSGDGSIAVLATISGALGVSSDAGGNLFIADTGNSRVRRVTSTGSVSTVAGNGTQGYAGDGGPATLASLSQVSGVALDSTGNLYLSDTGNSVVRKVTPGGVITTYAGNGINGYGGDNGNATSASLSVPRALAVDSQGNLYIGDSGNARVRKVTPLGLITTIAGNGSPGYSGDGGLAIGGAISNSIFGLAVDAGGNVYISDSGNERVRRVNPAGIITTVAGNGTPGFSGDGGPATLAMLNAPYGLAFDALGDLYIADSGNNAIRKVLAIGGTITTIAGGGAAGFAGDGGPATLSQFNSPRGVGVDAAGNVYIADSGNQRIRRVTTTGVVNTVSGNGSTGFSGDGGLATLATLSSPNGVAVNSVGTLFISDDSGRIRRVGSSVPFHLGSFAQLASGNGWKTSIALVNISAGSVTARLNLYADNGSPLTLPLTQGSTTVTASFIDVTIPSRGTVVIETEATTPTIATGWADLLASVPESLRGYGIFRSRVAGMPDLEGTSPLDTEGLTALTLPYDNTGGFSTGVAIALVGSGTNLNARLRDQNGNVLSNTQITMPSFGHMAFFVHQVFPQAANLRGTIELDTPSGTITALGLRFNPTSSFTSVPVIR